MQTLASTATPPAPFAEPRVYTFISDPGHAWLAVPRDAVIAAGVLEQVTPYSYQTRDGATLYLEEDCDAPLFLKAATALGARYVINEAYCDTDSPIRRLPRVNDAANRY